MTRVTKQAIQSLILTAIVVSSLVAVGMPVSASTTVQPVSTDPVSATTTSSGTVTAFLGDEGVDLTGLPGVTAGAASTFSGERGDADGTVATVSDGANADITSANNFQTGGYDAPGATSDDSPELFVVEPVVTDLTLYTGNGTSGTDVTDGTISGDENEVTVEADWNFATTEALEVTVEDNSGLDVTAQLTDDATITQSNGSIVLSGLSNFDDGEYTVAVEGEDDLDSASRSATFTIQSQHTSPDTIKAVDAPQTANRGDSVTVTYQIQNPTEQSTASLVEFSLPSDVTLESVSGDVQQDLTGSSPPGVITSQISPGSTTTVDVTYNISSAASTGSTTFEAAATFSSNGQAITESTETSIDITDDFLALSDSPQPVAKGATTTLTYEIQNPTQSSNSVLFEVTSLPSGVVLDSIDGDVQQDLTGSTPPAVITTQLSADGSATVSITVNASENASTGTSNLTTRATAEVNQEFFTDTNSTSLEITEADPVTSRFGGSDKKIDNLDVLQAVNAANNAGEIGGAPVSNLDVLQVVNRANQR